MDTFTNKAVEKRFGLSRATTLLYFLSGGRFPIFDSRVRRAIRLLHGTGIPNTVQAYVTSYVPLFMSIAAACRTTDLRGLDRALFAVPSQAVHPSEKTGFGEVASFVTDDDVVENRHSENRTSRCNRRRAGTTSPC